MATKLKLVKPSVPTDSMARRYRSIVAGLRLDSVQVPKHGKKRRTTSTPKVGKAVVAGVANDGFIYESGRNNALTSMGGAMRRNGMTETTIDEALRAENKLRCRPPLDDSEVSAIATSLMRYAPSDAAEVFKSLTDTGNAARFGRRYADHVKYVFGRGWVIWDGLRWLRDETEQIMELAKKLAREIYKEGEALDDDALRVAIAKHSKASLQSKSLKAMIELARSLPELVTHAILLDTHDMLFGVANGVVNLRTGKFQATRREDLMTRHSPVAFDATAMCPLFEAFIHQVTGGDKTLARYLQRVVGYSLCGVANERCIFFLYGSGRNGKSTFLNVVTELLGTDLALRVQPETLMVKRNPGINNDVARLHSVRVVVANEVEQGSQLAESLVKQFTGGETVSARFLHKEFFDFMPKFKPFIAGNHKPVVHGRDDGIWDRIRLIPFVIRISPSQCDKNLLVKLRAELPGILNWAIKGCLDWQKSGLAAPKVVTDAVDSYREEMDIIGQWVAECCTAGASFESKAGETYQNYKGWSEQNGYKPMAAGTFGRDFAVRYTRVKRNDGNYFQGIKMR